MRWICTKTKLVGWHFLVGYTIKVEGGNLDQTSEHKVNQSQLASLLLGRGELEFRRLLEKLPAGAYMCDREGLITYFNSRAVELWGRAPALNDPKDRFCGSFKLFTSDGSPIQHDECWMALALRNNVEYNGYEIIIERSDGDRITALAHANPIRDESGELIGAVNVLVDITDRKRAEEALRQAHDELERRVAKRTAALAASNELLQLEIGERKQAEDRARRQAANAKAQARAAALLNAQLDLETVLATICRITSTALRVPAVLVYLYDEQQSAFEFAAELGVPDAVQPLLKPWPWSLYSEYTKDLGPQKPLLNLHNGQELFAPELIDSLGLQGAIIVDLLRGNQLAGCLVALTDAQNSVFGSDDLTLLRGLADQAAQAITNARLLQEVQVRKSQLQQLSQRLLKAEEEERKRVSRELHDSLGQMTNALLIRLSLLQRNFPAGIRVSDDLEAVREVVYKIHDELHSMSQTLRPPQLELIGLDAALRGLCHELSHFIEQPIIYQGVVVPTLSDTIKVALYRFTQEALNNAIKHANANYLKVLLAFEGGHLSVRVEDDGVGFDAQAVFNGSDGEGVGLMSMRERLEMLGGDLEINSMPGAGTQLIASFHLSKA